MAGKRAILFILLAGVLVLKAWQQETVRLVEGPDAKEGRVEVYYSGEWGVICGAGWDVVDAAVVCHSLGYGGVSLFQRNISFKPENGTTWMSELQCIGNETSLADCAHAGWGRNACAESQAAGVRCFERARPQFISSSLDTITLEFHAPTNAHVTRTFTVQIWSNTTKKWRNTACSQSTVNDSCVVTNRNTAITITGLNPGHAYYVRIAYPTQWFSEVSNPMETMQLGRPVELQFISRSSHSIALQWASTSVVLTNYTVEMRCCEETTWQEASCMEDLIGQGCTVSDTSATVIGLKPDKKYYFRVYAVYREWKSDITLPSNAMVTAKPEEVDSSQFRIWISPVTPECVTTEIGHAVTLFCNTPSSSPTVYEWSKGGQVLSNKSVNGVLNVTVSSSEDFGLYICHAITSDGVTSYNISICHRTVGAVAVSTDSFNRTAIAVITACFICFATFIVVLILLKMARLHRRKKKQSLGINSGREEMAMLHYKQKSFRTANNNEDDCDS